MIICFAYILATVLLTVNEYLDLVLCLFIMYLDTNKIDKQPKKPRKKKPKREKRKL